MNTEIVTPPNTAEDILSTIALGLERGYSAADLLDENSPIRDRMRLWRQSSHEPDAATIRLYHVDDCMYIAARSEEDVRQYVLQDCGPGCCEELDEIPQSILIETANTEDGEAPTATSKLTARELIEQHVRAGGSLPYTVGHDPY